MGKTTAALGIGGVAGAFAARKIRMTAMPELVSLFNGMGGACAALISILEFDKLQTKGELLIILAGLIIGSVSFAGSIIAWGKLNGKIKDIAFVLPIGGADMPVVISLLNSFTGVAAACGGFLYNNKAMLTGGILVGAAGTVLTILMCKAMNRSLKNVLIGSFGGSTTTTAGHATGRNRCQL